MSCRYIALTLAVWILAVLPLPAQVSLAWKFTEGETFFVERVIHQKQAIEAKGKSAKPESTTTAVWRFTVKKSAAGQTVLEQTIESVASKRTGKAAGVDEQLARRMKGSTFTLTLNADGRVTKLEGYETHLKRLAENKPETEKALRTLSPESAMKDELENLFGFLPGKPVKKGDQWQREWIEPLNPFGSFKVTSHYAYQGLDQGLEVIAFQVRIAYAPPTEEFALFKVVKGELTAENGKGAYRFDAQKGRLVSAEQVVRVRGRLTIEANGKQADLGLTSDNSVRLRVLAKNPGEKAESDKKSQKEK